MKIRRHSPAAAAILRNSATTFLVVAESVGHLGRRFVVGFDEKIAEGNRHANVVRRGERESFPAGHESIPNARRLGPRPHWRQTSGDDEEKLALIHCTIRRRSSRSEAGMSALQSAMASRMAGSGSRSATTSRSSPSGRIVTPARLGEGENFGGGHILPRRPGLGMMRLNG
jgi:hypothetical protein